MATRFESPTDHIAPPSRPRAFRRTGPGWTPLASDEPGAPPVRRRRRAPEVSEALSASQVENAPSLLVEQGAQAPVVVPAAAPLPWIQREENGPMVAAMMFAGLLLVAWLAF